MVVAQRPFQERGVAEVLGGGAVQFGGQRFGRGGQTQRGQVPAQLLVERVLTHRTVAVPVAGVPAAAASSA
jgi:hypothetical protein